ncbi:MAG: NAD(P)/FAD-dependent oxidoreductase [Candidatus Latescibacterota bacterium]|nr:NAD(P)/FAD-dependent oxidoreductase [Candidatus Latescibacterota bacterium]
MAQIEPDLAVEVAVVGGGAAGMMAAIQARASGAATVALLEANDRLGRKIFISGNGRCNLTNEEGDEPSHYHGTHPRFCHPALKSFSVADTLGFFSDLGIVPRTEKRGRLFPMSDQAQSVVDVLDGALTDFNVDVRLSAPVRALLATNEGGFILQCDGIRLAAEKVILCGGGISVAKLGADGSCIAMAEVLGHECTDLLPGLVPVVSDDRAVRQMQGVRVWAQVTGPARGQRLIADTDDLLLTKYGLSGFAILSLSAQLVPVLAAEGPQVLNINLFPGSSREQLSEILASRWQRHPNRTLARSFAGLLHGKVALSLLEKAGLDADQVVSNVGKRTRWELAGLLTDWQVTVSGPRDFDYAEVTIGGIRTDEIDPHTMESYIVPGLYLAGEMVDVHGDLGGFNFQWAWSSGHRAGTAAASR